MRSVKQYVTTLLFVGIVFAVGVGCPSGPPSVTVALLIAPASLDFGTALNVLQFNVAKNYTSKPLPTVSITADKNWILPNPTTANSTGPSHPATITVTIDRTKLVAGTNTGTITIGAPGVVPKTVSVTAVAEFRADFTGSPTTVVQHHSVQFTDTSVSSGAPIDSWDWDFGDGGPHSNLQNPSHVYNTLGDFTVTLTVTAGGLTDSETKNNYIHVILPVPPTANFSAADTTPTANVSLQFTDLSTPGTSPISTWLWTFGDGGTSGTKDPTHIYTAVAVYSVYLNVITADGSDDELKVNYINVQPQAPTANFVADDTTPASGTPVQFTDLSNPGSGPITEWWWGFGDGGTATSRDPSHIYTIAAASKTYSVYLTVVTFYGLQDTELKVNYINVHKP